MIKQTPVKSCIIPYLYYEDVAGALEWLVRAFGFRERRRIPGSDGKIAHAEMEFDGAALMMGHPGPQYRCPKRLGHVTQTQYVSVANVDNHYNRAKAAGAKIIAEPMDKEYGDRIYGAEDIEGHHWYFAQNIHKSS